MLFLTPIWKGPRPSPRTTSPRQSSTGPWIGASCDVTILGYRPPTVTCPDVGGNKELVIHEKTGLIVEKQNPSALAQAIMEFKENPSRTLEMGRAGRKYIMEKFTREKTWRYT